MTCIVTIATAPSDLHVIIVSLGISASIAMDADLDTAYYLQRKMSQ